MALLTGVLALGLAVVHLVAGRLRFLEGIPRSRWLSLAGGVSIAYVFIHVFPELASVQETLRRAAGASLAFLEHHAYLVALAGLAIFYGLERVVKTAQRRQGQRPDAGEGETTTGMGVFWLHMSSFAVYNALVGYLLLHREQQNWQGLLFFFLAMLFHFVVNDYGLRQDHKDTYHRYGRWLLYPVGRLSSSLRLFSLLLSPCGHRSCSGLLLPWKNILWPEILRKSLSPFMGRWLQTS